MLYLYILTYTISDFINYLGEYLEYVSNEHYFIVKYIKLRFVHLPILIHIVDKFKKIKASKK